MAVRVPRDRPQPGDGMASRRPGHPARMRYPPHRPAGAPGPLHPGVPGGGPDPPRPGPRCRRGAMAGHRWWRLSVGPRRPPGLDHLLRGDGPASGSRPDPGVLARPGTSGVRRRRPRPAVRGASHVASDLGPGRRGRGPRPGCDPPASERSRLLMRGTKVVCTLGPATEDRVADLVDAGMDVARINLTHQGPEDRDRLVAAVREASAASGKPVAVMADLSGPKVRLGELRGGEAVLRQGTRFTLRQGPAGGGENGGGGAHPGGARGLP